MARKKQFLVFCVIFLAVILLLGLGAWHTRAGIERHGARGRADPAPGAEAAPEAPSSEGG